MQHSTGHESTTGTPTGAGENADGALRVSDTAAALDIAQSDVVATPGRRPGAPRFVMIVVAMGALVLALAGLKFAQDIVAPMFLALNLIIIVYPLQSWLNRRVGSIIGAAASLITVLMLLALLIGLTAWSLIELVQSLPNYKEQFNQVVSESQDWLTTIGVSREVLQNSMQSIDPSSVLSFVTPIFSNTTSILSLLATLIIGVFFLAMDSIEVEERVERVSQKRPHIATALVDFTKGVRRYWIVTTIFGLIVAVLDVVALMIIQVPLVLVWGVLSFITNYIPNIGFVIGLIPPALLALLALGPWQMVAVIAAYCILNFVVQAIIQPKIAGESVGVTPTVSFLSLLLWVAILGWLGSLIALPATLLMKALLVDADPEARWFNALISSDKTEAKAMKSRRLERRTAAARASEDATPASV